MIKNIIFDFGDIFINLDKQIVFREAERFGGTAERMPQLQKINNEFEVGAISPTEFVSALQEVYPKASTLEIENIWNGMLLDFPDYRLEFITKLAGEKKYRLFLLSNTNAMHIPYLAKKWGYEKYNEFKNCFEKFYLSQEIGMRKPNAEIFEFVLNENGLIAEETFFIDDTKENTDAAEKLGIHCWNLQVGKEDIIDLKSKL
ncbi:HAD family phosphatase [Aurantibacter crassamenti]|uniref:HAD family hydrolase n=1 Tax=Aurantibacter crassamenti TaxID=1837375 RepID=UPI0019392AF1|nr:HAD family phosphatase [Aurantibacter crassamenti]MBM1107515.1 HAD family phosphatase [Aurantibacter crassamenti]